MTNPMQNRALPSRSPIVSRPDALALAALGGALALAALTGCQTVRGLGEDITYASDKTAEAITGEEHPEAAEDRR